MLFTQSRLCTINKPRYCVAAKTKGNLLEVVQSLLNKQAPVCQSWSFDFRVLPITSGVPQGSILGPLLFLIYINDLPDRLSVSKIFIFADNAKCFMPISSISDSLALQSDLSSLVDWSRMWKLNFNENKCCVIHFSTKIQLFRTPSTILLFLQLIPRGTWV